MENNAQLEKLKSKIPYNSNKYKSQKDYESKLLELLEDSKNIALSTLYPFLEDFEGIELPAKYKNWQIRACVEIYNWQGNTGVKSYSENGLNWSRNNDGAISDDLLNELEPPQVGIPKRRDTVDNK